MKARHLPVESGTPPRPQALSGPAAARAVGDGRDPCPRVPQGPMAAAPAIGLLDAASASGIRMLIKDGLLQPSLEGSPYSSATGSLAGARGTWRSMPPSLADAPPTGSEPRSRRRVQTIGSLRRGRGAVTGGASSPSHSGLSQSSPRSSRQAM